MSERYKPGQVVYVDNKPTIIIGEGKNQDDYYVTRKTEDDSVYIWNVHGSEISHYKNHCWNEKCGYEDINSEMHDTCPACHWVKCPECRVCRKPECKDDGLVIGRKPSEFIVKTQKESTILKEKSTSELYNLICDIIEDIMVRLEGELLRIEQTDENKLKIAAYTNEYMTIKKYRPVFRLFSKNI
jgi:hypothetical protein